MAKKSKDKAIAETEEELDGELDEEQDEELDEDEDLDEEDDEEDEGLDEEDEEDEGLDEEDEEDEELDEEDEELDEDEDELEDDEFDDSDLAAPDESPEDPFWWTPHLTLGLLLTIGLLGFFGFFNDYLGFLAAHPSDGDDEPEPATSQAPATPPPPTPNPAQRPTARAMPQGEIYGAKHVLIQYKGSNRAGPNITLDKDAAKKRAEEVAQKAAKLVKDNQDFEALSTKFGELAKKFSDEPGADKRGGDLGRFRAGSMVPAFQAAVEKLKKGEVSGVVESDFGYHVILRTL
jgi:parvulin-like peptidyl-prolyl isomerase